MTAVAAIPGVVFSRLALPAELVLAGTTDPLEILTLPSSTTTTLAASARRNRQCDPPQPRRKGRRAPGGAEVTETVAVIPARGGSKGVPRKNLRRVGGVPLVARAIAAARASATVDLVVVSTDDDEIAATAKEWGAEVIQRPAALADDTASSESALLHALDALEAGGVRWAFSSSCRRRHPSSTVATWTRRSTSSADLLRQCLLRGRDVRLPVGARRRRASRTA